MPESPDFRLGQQHSKITSLESRLDKIEPRLEEVVHIQGVQTAKIDAMNNQAAVNATANRLQVEAVDHKLSALTEKVDRQGEAFKPISLFVTRQISQGIRTEQNATARHKDFKRVANTLLPLVFAIFMLFVTPKLAQIDPTWQSWLQNLVIIGSILYIIITVVIIPRWDDKQRPTTAEEEKELTEIMHRTLI